MFMIAAISLGFLGSFHCIGMCGPVAMSLPYNSQTKIGRLGEASLYNSGRLLTYVLLGVLFGMLGQGFTLAGLQDVLSVSLGIVILLFLVAPGINFITRISYVNKGLSGIRSLMGRLFSQHTLRALFFIGVLNGLLPCGLVYMGIAGAIAVGDIWKGGLFMIGFGLGTLPAMLAIGLAGNMISLQARMKIRKMMPAFIGAMAVLLILRGLNLGVPYLSPSLKHTQDGQYYECCKK